MQLLAERCPWYVAGPLIGLTVVGMLAVTNLRFGALGGFIDLLPWIRQRATPLKWTVYVLIGTILGGFIHAVVSGTFVPTWDYGSFDARYGTNPVTRGLLLVVAGAVMGFGARRMAGCTSGHGICGNALGSRASFVSTATFMAVAIVVTQLVHWMGFSR